MEDSPALNPHSRMVLIPLAPTQLPSLVSVSGPGPVESHSCNVIVEPPPPPPASEKKLPNPQGNEAEEPVDGDAGSDRDSAEPPMAGKDPYANLDGAFGNYLADQPRPIRNDLDDLLF